MIDFNKELIDSAKLDFYLSKNKNVLFGGDHGVGKTASVHSAFQRNNLKSLYFAGATLDAHIDVVGIPKVFEKGDLKYIELIQREYFADGSLEAIFIDELNRAPKKVRNATMELIQFKSINGKRLPNLKVVWAAINENEDVYDVEPLDPALRDRFHIEIPVPYKCCPVFFKNKYGQTAAKSIIEWWDAIAMDIKNPNISPRRLSEAIDFWLEGGDIDDVLYKVKNKVNISALIEALNTEPIEQVLERLYKKNDPIEIKTFINSDNNLSKSLDAIKFKDEYLDTFIPKLNNEKLGTTILDNTVLKHVLENYSSVKHYRSLIDSIIKTNSNAPLADKCKEFLVQNDLADKSILTLIKSQVNEDAQFYFKESKSSVTDMFNAIKSGYDLNGLTFIQKERIWQSILTNIPEKMNETTLPIFIELMNAVGNTKGASYYPWKKLENFVPVLNHICKNLFEYGSQPNKIRSTFAFYSDLKDSDVENLLYIPPSEYNPRNSAERHSRASVDKIKHRDKLSW
jgi:hypothetical protein